MKFTHKYLLAFAFLFLLFGAKETFACSCAPPSQTTNDDFQKATTVFTGKVLSVQRKEGAPTVTVKLAVQRYWKGKVSNEIKITTASNSAACGFNFEVGKDYLVYATDNNGKLSTGLCSRTAAIGATRS
jgi:Tissue inhibitor of metalloproteinase